MPRAKPLDSDPTYKSQHPGWRANNDKKLAEIQVETKNVYATNEHGERPWGSWTVLEAGEGYCIKHIKVAPGQRLSLQYHRHRSENWVIIAGEGEVTLDDRLIKVVAGDHVHIPLGAHHRVLNPSDKILKILELQSGLVLDEADIVRIEDDYDRS